MSNTRTCVKSMTVVKYYSKIVSNSQGSDAKNIENTHLYKFCVCLGEHL